MADKYEAIRLFYDPDDPLNDTMICEIKGIDFREIQREPLDWLNFLTHVKRELIKRNWDEYAALVDQAIRDNLPQKRGLTQ